MTVYASDRDLCRVLVEDVSDDWTLCYDYKTGNERRVPTSAPGGIMPLPGDVWMLSKSANGIWEFESCLDRNVDSHQRSMAEVLDMLDRVGLIRWRPDENDDPMSRHGYGYIGELRRFPTSIIPDGWWQATGSQTASIQKARRLFREIGTTYGGDGITTFGLPNVRDDNSAAITTFSTGWAAWVGRENHVARSGPVCIVQGIAQNTSGTPTDLPAPLCTLPVGFRPIGAVAGTGYSSSTPIRVTSDSSGLVTAQDPTGTFAVAANGFVEFGFNYRLESTTAAMHWLICGD